MRNALPDDPDFYRTSKFDIFIVALVLLFSIASLSWFTHRRALESSQPKAALVYLKGKLIEQVDLTKDKTIGLLGGKMLLEVKNRKIRVLKAECPHQICVNMGWIKYSGQTIACVPNKVLIELKPTGTQVLDAVSY